MNTNTTVLSVKLDKKLKEQAQEVARAAGFRLSTLVNAYLNELVWKRRIEFEAPLELTPKLKKILDEADADIKSGKNLIGPFNGAKDAIAFLHSDKEKI